MLIIIINRIGLLYLVLHYTALLSFSNNALVLIKFQFFRLNGRLPF